MSTALEPLPPGRVDHPVQPKVNPQLSEALEPFLSTRLGVLCGTCHRVYGTAYPVRVGPDVFVTLERHTKVRKGSGGSRPWVKFELIDELELVEGGRCRITCYPKCNGRRPRKWVFDQNRLATAFVRAARAGRTELVFGDNLL